MGTLYLVGTPIGNLGDFSPRAAEILASVDFIAAEDTRVTMKLLSHFGIKKPLVSYFEHNAAERGPHIVERLQAGEDAAIVTDAGMPCISDPGEGLVALCHEHGIPIKAVPGPTAAMTALAVSGLPTKHFVFEGFLPVKKSERQERLELLRPLPQTLIFYEAPHKLITTLSDLLETLGDRRISLCREITKIYEEADLTTLSGAVTEYETREPRGEYVLIVEGAPEKTPGEGLTLEAAAQLVRDLAASGVSLSDAAKQVARDSGYRKGELYKLALEE